MKNCLEMTICALSHRQTRLTKDSMKITVGMRETLRKFFSLTIRILLGCPEFFDLSR